MSRWTFMDEHGEFIEGLLSSRLDRPVIDKTGLLDDLISIWSSSRTIVSPDFGGAEELAEPGTSVGLGDGAGPSIFTALPEQLGLKLSAATGRAEVSSSIMRETLSELRPCASINARSV